MALDFSNQANSVLDFSNYAEEVEIPKEKAPEQSTLQQVLSIPKAAVKDLPSSLLGIGESAANLVTFIPRAALGTFTGLAAAIDKGDSEAFPTYFNKAMEQLKIPENKAGQLMTSIASYPFEKTAEVVAGAAHGLDWLVRETWKDMGHKPTDDQEKALGAYTALIEAEGSALPLGLGLGAKGLVKTTEKTPIETQTGREERELPILEVKPSEISTENLTQKEQEALTQNRALAERNAQADKIRGEVFTGQPLGSAGPVVSGKGPKEELPVDENGTILSHHNEPWITKGAAKTNLISKGLEDTHVVTGYKGGYAIVPKPLGGTGKKGFGQGGAIDFSTLAEIPEEGAKVNASGESAASMEAVNRLQSQNQAGIKLFELDPERGSLTPLVTAERVDKRAGEGKAIVQQDADGNVTIVDNNSRLGNVPLANRSKYMLEQENKKPLGGTGKTGFGQGGAVDLSPIKDAVDKVGEIIKNTFKGEPVKDMAVKSLDDRLAKNKQMNTRDETDINSAITELHQKAGLTDEMERKFIDRLEGVPVELAPHEEAIFKDVVPHAQDYFVSALKEFEEAGGKDINYDPSIFPRFAIGKGGFLDRMLEASRVGQGAIIGNRTTAPSSAKARSVMALEMPDGSRRTVTMGKDNTLTAWDKGTPEVLGKFNGKLKLGDEFTSGGLEGGKLKQATFKEASENTDVTYFPKAIETLLRKGQELKAAARALEVIKTIKEDPQFSQFAMKDDAKDIPADWRYANLGINQLRNYKFDPKIAEVLEDYAPKGADNMGLKSLGLIQNGIIKALFLWPLPHMANEGAHWVPARGLEGWFTSTGWKELIENGGRAYKSVMEQDAIQREITEAGGQLLYPSVRNEYYWKNQIKDSLDKVKDQGPFRRLAGDLGMSPVTLVNKLSEISNKSMWAVRDMMVTELYLTEKQKNPNLSPQEIMTDIERHMPAYRIPSRVLGSRSLAKVMKQPLLSVFSYYHYGMAKSFLEFGKSMGAPITGKAFAGRTAMREFGDAASKAAMLGVLYAVLYPAFDKLMEETTGVKGKFRRAGGLHLAETVAGVAERKKQPQDLARALVTPAPGAVLAMELMFNHDLFTGRQLTDFGKPVKEQAKDIAAYAAEQLNPLRTAGGVLKGNKSAGNAMMEYFADYRPTDAVKESRQQLKELMQQTARETQ